MKILTKEYLFKIIPRVNLLLIFSLILLMIYFCINLLALDKSFSLDKQRLEQESKLINGQLSMQIKNLPVFQEDIFRKRSLFNSLSEIKPKQESEFELLGLVSVGKRTTAMIRDNHQKKDYYCVGGEDIGAFGEFKVKQILKDRVILESGGKTIELTQ